MCSNNRILYKAEVPTKLLRYRQMTDTDKSLNSNMG